MTDSTMAIISSIKSKEPGLFDRQSHLITIYIDSNAYVHVYACIGLVLFVDEGMRLLCCN